MTCNQNCEQGRRCGCGTPKTDAIYKEFSTAMPNMLLVPESLARTLERELSAEKAKVARLREALQIIAGQRPCVDNLLSNSDIAHLALKEGA